MRFYGVEASDLFHPAWLLHKAILPRLPPFLHGALGAKTPKGKPKVGWTKLPCGLKVSAEQLQSTGVRLLLLPRLFLHRRAELPVPNSSSLEDQDPERPLDWNPFAFELMCQHVMHSLPPFPANATIPSFLLLEGERRVDIVPHAFPPLVTLKQGVDKEVEILTMASTLFGSSGLQDMLESVPFTVHAVSVGAKHYWPVSLRDVPPVMRSLSPDRLIVFIDAYDVVLLPCARSIAAEFKKFNKEIVIAAEKVCWPSAALCLSCHQRYVHGSDELEACLSGFPNINGGAYMVSRVQHSRWQRCTNGSRPKEMPSAQMTSSKSGTTT